MPRKLTDQQLIAFLDHEANDDVPDDALVHLVEEFDFDEEAVPDDWEGRLRAEDRLPFASSLSCDRMRGGPKNIPNFSTSNRWILGALNRRSRRKRKSRFDRKRKGGFSGITIVSEGDSWFQYPIYFPRKWPKDVIDHLMKRKKYNILSLGAGGDWLSNMLKTPQYWVALLDEYRPSVLLVSGGGNDLVGKKRLKCLLKHFKPGQPAAWYLKPHVTMALGQLKTLYTELFQHLSAAQPGLKVICHGYAYVRPDGGKWFGKPMNDIKIKKKSLQTAIAKEMIKRFNDMLKQVAENFSYTYLDLTKKVGLKESDWHDELHLKTAQTKEVAKYFVKAIDNAVSDK